MLGEVVRERASRALSMPVALRVGAGLLLLLVVVEEGVVSDEGSNWERSRVPLVFLGAVFALAFLGVERCDFSSSARRASRSDFLRAASAFLSASASLERKGGEGQL